ncbi:MAG: bifunctional folylpolyglutamate synthase/dihydrofolate synthase [Lachnospiraceae bacterium]|nr:bifunctional folylpolyglutamate synthase/dihydrofolate synthase [Lachnospiraceae bacterium]
MTYKEALDYIHSLYWRGKKSGLEKTKELLDLCGHPEQGLRCIHIAGTNGKGSTAAMLESVCRCAGMKIGLYTSPYIVRYNERIQVNREEIPDERLAELTEYLAGVTEQMEVPPSEFEFGTVLAFLYFKEQQCDLVILETGLGGTFDSTNVIEEPLLCVITALGFDHTAQLGTTMTEIAEAKAGIIKQGVPVVFYGENPEGEAVIRRRCEEKGAPLFLPCSEGLTSEYVGSVFQNQRFSYQRPEKEDAKQQNTKGCNWEHVELSLPGLYQQKNATVVLEAVEQLRSLGIVLPEDAVREGLRTVFWQARLEVLQSEPLILADGSHNPQGMQATVESLKQYFPGRQLQFIFGAMADKELDVMIPMFLSLAKKIYVTAPAMPRAMKAEALCLECEKNCDATIQPELVICKEAKEALSLAKQEAKDEVIVVIGSLYLVGEIKQIYTKK